MVQQLSSNTFTTAKWIVSATASDGTHTTIATALTSASSGDTIFIRPGTYTENLTLKAGVNLTSYSCEGLTTGTANIASNVVIVGKLTASYTGNVYISGITLKTNGDYAIECTSGTVALMFSECNLFCNDFSGLHCTNASCLIELQNCNGTIQNASATFCVITNGVIKIEQGNYYNSVSSVVSTVSGGSLAISNAVFGSPITISGGAAVTGENTTFTSPIIMSGTCTFVSTFSNISGATASAVSIGAGCTATIYDTIINSSNTNALTGAGTLIYANLTFGSTSSLMNVTTQTAAYSNLGKYKATGQPLFDMTLNGTISNITGDGTVYTVVFDATNVDQNSNCTSNTTFTAPVAGRYLFCASLFMTGIGVAHTSSTIGLYIGGSAAFPAKLGGVINPGVCKDAVNTLTLSITGVLNLAATNAVTLTVMMSGSTKTVDITADNRLNYFNGYLLG
jgi:hypothetical protein